MVNELNLPVCHVYYPDTFCKVLETYFSNGTSGKKPCYVVGYWELRNGKPGRKRKSFLNEGQTSYKDVIKNSPPIDDSKGQGSENLRRVLAVTIIGISSDEIQTSHRKDCGNQLEIIGKVEVKDEGNDIAKEGSSGIRLYFEFNPRGGYSSKNQSGLSMKSVAWNGYLYNLYSTSRLIVFHYNPIEFQQWKIPEDHPAGVPPVFINGISYMQQELQDGNQIPFIPAFTPTLRNHQNLNACSEPTTSSSQLCTNSFLNFITNRSSGIQQISHKVSLLTEAVLGSYQLLPVFNFLVLLVLDSLVGYLITSYLLQVPNLLGLLHSTVEDMLESLNHLLRWLRGAPAGLKLNANLNSLYWRFFSYHIHLWANYIGILEPVFAIILHTIQFYGFLGSTIQVSLLKDLLSLATFHVYCLYIYATRLYSLQTSAIKSLCRIFFGRKSNPLRGRIDNVQLTTPELFLSSFGFVILIFLLPTTLVYYAGFVCLRVPVLLMERTLEYFVKAFNKLPIVSWALVYMKSPRVADEIYLGTDVRLTERISDSNKNNFIAFRLCLQSTRTLFSPPDFAHGIKSIVGSVIDGTVLKD